MSKGQSPCMEVKTSVEVNGKTHYRKVGVAWKTKSGGLSVKFDEPGPYDSVLLTPIK